MSRVRTRRGIAILISLAVASLAFFYFLWPREPAYQGKPLTAWLKQFATNHWAAGFGGDLDRQAEDAIQHIGTNAVPIYLQMMTPKESPLKVKLLALASKPWLARFHISGVAEYRMELNMRKKLGVCGFVALGAKAKPFVPALIALISDKDWETRCQAVFALGCLGPAASEALPEVIGCLNDQSEMIRIQAVIGLGKIHQKPEKTAPILINFIKKYRIDREWRPSLFAIQSLGKFGAQAKPAVPILLELLNDPRTVISDAATNALRDIDRDAVAKTGVK